MTHQVDNLLESIIQITKERDKKSLITVLIEVLHDLVSAEAIIVFKCLPGNHNDQLEVAACHPEGVLSHYFEAIPNDHGSIRVHKDHRLQSCIQQKAMLQPANDAYLFPILVNNTVASLVAIFGHTLSEETQKIIDGFLRIYSNFLTVIDENERDTLTNLLNRKTLNAQLTSLLSEAQTECNARDPDERRTDKQDTHYWVGIIDIDHFKSINDNYGHIYGDEVLLLFSDLMKRSFRHSDLLFRYGGEEFVVVLSPATYDDASMIFERFRTQLSETRFPQVDRVTCSIGFVKVELQKHISTILEHADMALYYAKDHGRDQVRNYCELVAQGLLTERSIDTDIELF